MSGRPKPDLRSRHAAAVLLGLAVALVAVPAASAASGAAMASGEASTGGGVAEPFQVRDNGIPGILPGAVAGDPARGRAIVADRQAGLCLLCHTGPFPEERFQGNLAPDLAGAGERATAAQLRLRIADASRLNPETIMPSYYRTKGLSRVAAAYEGKPILSAQQIEDVVAFLQTLRTLPPREGAK